MNQVFLSDSCFAYFGTSSVTTGAATNADSTPSVVVAEDGTDLGYAPTVTNVATGLYKVEIAATSGNGFEAGRRYNLYAVATVGGITGRDGIGEFEVLAVDMNTALDAAISSRMATYTQPTGFLTATFPATVASTTNITAGTITTVSGNVDGNVTGSVGSVVGAVGSVTAAVTVGTINANVVNASALAADAVTEIQAGLATSAEITALNDISVADILAGAALAPIASNTKKINDVDVIGTGVAADLWRA